MQHALEQEELSSLTGNLFPKDIPARHGLMNLGHACMFFFSIGEGEKTSGSGTKNSAC